jgi:hypothetical protein
VKTFLHVIAHKNAGAIDDEKLAAALKKADDWMTYAPGVWILLTDENGGVWRDRFKDFADTVLVTEFVPNSTYWAMRSDTWKWFEKHDMGFKVGEE